jgi:DNA-binding protein YbaB
MFDGGSLGDAERLIDEWRGTIEERAARARALESRLARLTETARSPDGLVTVTIDGQGDLTALKLAEGIRQRPAELTAREILATLRVARGALVTAVRAAAAETMGPDTATGRVVVESFTSRLMPGGEGRV